MISFMPKYFQNTIMVFIIVIYISAFYFNYRYAGIINPKIELRYLTANIFSSIVMLFMIAFMIFNLKLSNYLLLLMIIVYPISYNICRILLNKNRDEYLLLLDSLEETPDSVEIPSLRLFEKLILEGFRYSHPVIFKWNMYTNLISKWGNHLSFWILNIKFLAIYPEETKKLEWTITQMYQKGFKITLTKELKTKLNRYLSKEK